MNNLDDFQKQAVVIALKKMFQGNYFDICTVDRCLKITGSIPPTTDYNALHAMHCVHWSDMPAGFRHQVFEKTLELFNHTVFPIEKISLSAALSNLKALQ